MRTVASILIATVSCLAGCSAQLSVPLSASAAEAATAAAVGTFEDPTSNSHARFAAAKITSMSEQLPGTSVQFPSASKARACKSLQSSQGSDADMALSFAAAAHLDCKWVSKPSAGVKKAVSGALASKSVPSILAALEAAKHAPKLLDGKLVGGSKKEASDLVQMLIDSFDASGESAWAPFSSDDAPRSAAVTSMALRSLALVAELACPSSDEGEECQSMRQSVVEAGAQASVLLDKAGVAGPGSSGDVSLSLEVSDWLPEREEALGDAMLTKQARAQVEAFWATHGSPAQATGQLASALMDLHAVTRADLEVTADQLAAMAQALVTRAHEAASTGNVEQAAAALDGLVALSRRNVVSVPVALQVVPAKGDRVAVRASDPLGAPLADAKGCVLRAQLARQLSGPEESDDLKIDLEFSLRKPKAGAKSQDTVFVAKGVSAALSAQGGTFELDLTFAPPDSPSHGPPLHSVEATSRAVRLPLKAALKNGEVLVSSSPRASDDSAVVSRSDIDAKGRGAATVTAGSAQYVHVLFSVTASGASMQPHQALVRLTPRSGPGSAAFFVARVDSGDESEGGSVTMRASINVGDRRELGAAADGGAFDAAIVIGDSRLSVGLEVPVGTVVLETPSPPPAQEEILYSKPLLHESDTATAPLREIVHQFNPPEKQPPIVVPLAVTGGLAAVLALFVTTVGALSHSWRSPGAAGLGLLAVVGSMLAVLGLYFFQAGPVDNAFTALALLGILSVPALFVGRSALGALAAQDAK